MMKPLLKNIVLCIMILIAVDLVSQDTELPAIQEVIDSVLTADIDSLEVEGLSSEVVEETVSIEELEHKLLNFITERKNSRKYLNLPFLHHSENFHYSALFDPIIIFQKIGFSLIPYKVKNYHVFQNFQSLLLTDQEKGTISFYQENYDLPIPLTESFLALGDNNMNHAGIWFAKGDIFSIKDLQLETSYLGQEGDWLGVNETSRNFNLHVLKKYSFGVIHFNSTIIDQEISALKLTEDPVDDSAAEKFSDASVRFNTRFLNLGFRYEKWELNKNFRKTGSLLLNKDLSYRNHRLDLKYEYFRQSYEHDSEQKNLFSVDHNSRFLFINFTNNARYEDNDNYFIYSDLSCKLLAPLAVKLVVEQIDSSGPENIFFKSKKGIGFTIITKNINSELVAGKMQRDMENDNSSKNGSINIKYNYLEFKNIMDFKIGKFGFFIKNYLHYNNDYSPSEQFEISLIPKWQTKNTFEFSIDLNHGNAISIGLDHLFYSDLRDHTSNYNVLSSSFINCFFSIKISELFNIKADFINVTDEKSFPYSLDHSSISNIFDYNTHINFGVNWIFIN